MVIYTDTRLLNSKEAAERLGITQNRVQAMIRTGQLKTMPVDSRRKLITLQSVLAARPYIGHSGRPYSQDTAMGMLYLLANQPTDWLSAKKRYQARRHLSATDLDGLVRNLRNRATVMNYWTMDGNLTKIREEIRESGSDDDLRNRLELMPAIHAEGYVTAQELSRLVEKYRLKETSTVAKVRLHIFDHLNSTHQPMPSPVCAIDLAESNDIRERRAGINFLRDALENYRKGES